VAQRLEHWTCDQILLVATGNILGQAAHTHVPLVTKQHNLVPATGRWCFAAGKVTAGLAKVMAAYRRENDLWSPVGWLPVHRDQLRAQCSVTSMGSLYLSKCALTLFWGQRERLRAYKNSLQL